MTELTLALVVAEAGPFQDGLLALMTTLIQVGVVIVAEDAKSALRIVETHHPALIVLDLPSVQGAEVVGLMKAHPGHAHVIVLADDTAQQDQAGRAGADRVLLRGFSVQELIDAVANAPGDPDSAPCSPADCT